MKRADHNVQRRTIHFYLTNHKCILLIGWACQKGSRSGQGQGQGAGSLPEGRVRVCRRLTNIIHGVPIPDVHEFEPTQNSLHNK